MKRRRLRQGFAALAAAAFVPPLASAGAAPPKLDGLTLVSRDTIVDGIALHQSEVQPSLAADGTKKTLVGAFEVGRIFNGGSSAIGFARSDDGGKAWHDGLLPLTVGASRPRRRRGPSGAPPTRPPHTTRATDVARLVDRARRPGPRLGLFVNSSKDGKKWSAPVVAHAAAAGDAPHNGSLACDNAPASAGYGTCYLAYTNTASTPANQLSGRHARPTAARRGRRPWDARRVRRHRRRHARPASASGRGAGSTCGRVVVAYANGATVNASPRPTAAPPVGARGRHSTQAASHTVAQGSAPRSSSPARPTGPARSTSSGRRGASGPRRRRSRRPRTPATRTSRSRASPAWSPGTRSRSIRPARIPETVTIATVGTSGAGGHRRHVHARARLRAREGAFVTVNGVTSTSTAAPNDIALSVMPAPTDATPAPSFGVAARIPIEADTRREHEHGRPLHPGDRGRPGLLGLVRAPRALLLLLSALGCQYVNNPATHVLAAGRLRLVDRRRRDLERSAVALARARRRSLFFPRTGPPADDGNGNPDFGNVSPRRRRSRGQERRATPSGSSRSGSRSTGSTCRCTRRRTTLEIGGAS